MLRESPLSRTVGPRFGDIQAGIDQGGQLALAQRRKDAHLTIVHFAQTAIPLPGHTGGSVSLFGKGAFIEQ